MLLGFASLLGIPGKLVDMGIENSKFTRQLRAQESRQNHEYRMKVSLLQCTSQQFRHICSSNHNLVKKSRTSFLKLSRGPTRALAL